MGFLLLLDEVNKGKVIKRHDPYLGQQKDILYVYVILETNLI